MPFDCPIAPLSLSLRGSHLSLSPCLVSVTSRDQVYSCSGTFSYNPSGNQDGMACSVVAAGTGLQLQDGRLGRVLAEPTGASDSFICIHFLGLDAAVPTVTQLRLSQVVKTPVPHVPSGRAPLWRMQTCDEPNADTTVSLFRQRSMPAPTRELSTDSAAALDLVTWTAGEQFPTIKLLSPEHVVLCVPLPPCLDGSAHAATAPSCWQLLADSSQVNANSLVDLVR